MAKRGASGRNGRSDGRVVAITGTSEQLGSGLISLLQADPNYSRILAVDVREPELISEKDSYHYVDLTMPEAGQELAELFRTERVDTLVHLAFLSNPAHDAIYAHELQVAGTMHLLNAAGAAHLDKVIILGSTMVYGARPGNPNYLTEDTELSGMVGSSFIDDLLDVEQQLVRFAERRPQATATMLRMGGRLGGKVDTFISRMLSRSMVPMVMGHDPLMQLVHEKDALLALKVAVDHDHHGAFNIVADGVMTLSSILRMAGKLPLPIPQSMAEQLGGFLWTFQAVSVPPTFLDYLRYLWVADGSKARREMGLHFQYTTKETLLDYVRSERDESSGLSAAAG